MGLDVMVLEGGYKVRITTAKHPAGVLEPKKNNLRTYEESYTFIYK